MGPIKGGWIETRIKQEMLIVIEEAKDQGLSVHHSCRMLGISRRRVVRWQEMERKGTGLINSKPGPKGSLHSLLSEEREKVLEMAGKEEYADMSHRILTVTVWDKGFFSSLFPVLTAFCVLKN